ncbi:MAG: hypothetical protein IJY85_00545 [Ruminococcus sp.]|nr:hypothetical protein [Ruminococcus sp.]
MKKSFFKRSLASALSVCMVFTQSVLVTATVPTLTASAAGKTITLNDITYIAPDAAVEGDGFQHSDWNVVVADQIANIADNTSTALDVEDVKDYLAAQAATIAGGAYADLANDLLASATDAELTREGSNYTISCTLSGLNNIAEDTLQATFDEMAEEIVAEYPDASVNTDKLDVDLSDVEIGGELAVTIDASALEASRYVIASWSFVDTDGNPYTLLGGQNVIGYASTKLSVIEKETLAALDAFEVDLVAQLKEQVNAGVLDMVEAEIESEVAEKFDDLAVEVADIFDGYESKLAKAEDKIAAAVDKAENGSYSATADSFDAVLAELAAKADAKGYDIPASLAEVQANAKIVDAYNAGLDVLNTIAATADATVEITFDELIALAQSGSAVSVEVAGGKATVEFQIEDAEAAEFAAVKNAELAEDMLEVADSWKVVTAVVVGDSAAETAKVSLDIIREYTTKEIEETTTTEETTSTTEETTTTTEETTTTVGDETTTTVGDETTTTVGDETTTTVGDETTTTVGDETTTTVGDETTTTVGDETTTTVGDETTTTVGDETTTTVGDETTTTVGDETTTTVGDETTTTVGDETTTTVGDETTTTVGDETTTTTTQVEITIEYTVGEQDRSYYWSEDCTDFDLTGMQVVADIFLDVTTEEGSEFYQYTVNVTDLVLDPICANDVVYEGLKDYTVAISTDASAVLASVSDLIAADLGIEDIDAFLAQFDYGTNEMIGTMTVQIGMRGDINNSFEVDSDDAVMALKYYAETLVDGGSYDKISADSVQYFLGNVDFNDELGSDDAVKILKYYAEDLMGDADWANIPGANDNLSEEYIAAQLAKIEAEKDEEEVA